MCVGVATFLLENDSVQFGGRGSSKRERNETSL